MIKSETVKSLNSWFLATSLDKKQNPHCGYNIAQHISCKSNQYIQT